MRYLLVTLSSLLLSIGILLSGHGLLGTLLALRGAAEGFGTGTIGFFTSMYFLGYISGTFVGPRIIQRVGHIRTLATVAAVFASTSILQGFWINHFTWSVVRFISGICIVGFYMVIESWLNSQANNDNRGRMFGIYQLINLSFMAAGQFLITVRDIHTLDLFAIAAALIAFSLVPVALTRLPEPGRVAEIKVSVVKMFRVSPLGFMGCFISGVIGSVFWGLAPLYAQQAGLDAFGIALFMSITILGGILLQVPIGMWSDRNDRRRAIMLTGFLISIVTIVAALAPPGKSWLLTVSMFLFGGMLFSIYPLSVAHANDHPEALDRVTLSTNLLLTYGIGAVLGPFLVGSLMTLLGHQFMLYFFSCGGLFLGVFAWHRTRRGVEIPVEQQTTFVPLSRTTQVVADAGLHDPTEPPAEATGES